MGRPISGEHLPIVLYPNSLLAVVLVISIQQTTLFALMQMVANSTDSSEDASKTTIVTGQVKPIGYGGADAYESEE